jgi:metallophosphoesterase (TIGR00282 family)
LRVLYFADIVGRPGRDMIKYHLQDIKKEHCIDFVIVNGENASHGFGLTKKNADELFNMGIDLITGGNHSWDKKEIVKFIDQANIIRPINYPTLAPGSGEKRFETSNETIVVINLMGHFTMPMVDNPFTIISKRVGELNSEGIKNIFIDFHAEATSEKRALMAMLKGRVSAICGSHTHVGTDDLTIDEKTFYVTDVGLTGCRDNVIGMDTKEPLDKFLTSISSKFDIPKNCKKILQCVVVDIEDGGVQEAYKIKAYDEQKPFISIKAMIEG